MKRRIQTSVGIVTLAVIIAATGCGSQTSGPAPKVEPKEDPNKHQHGEGPNDGALASWGNEEYHPEFTVNHEKQEARIFILGPDAKTPAPIKANKILLNIKDPPLQLELKPEKQPGDPEGSASCFVGKHEKLGIVKEFSGTISGVVDGKPYSGNFAEVAHNDGKAHTKMPAGVSGTPFERDLFLRPGGIYTAADIKANGNTVPSEKYKGISWAHDDDLKPGDKVCPVTVNKADLKCSWIVNGKKYEFCCTPCLDKFVKWAKEQPNKVKEPEAYVHK